MFTRSYYCAKHVTAGSKQRNFEAKERIFEAKQRYYITLFPSSLFERRTPVRCFSRILEIKPFALPFLLEIKYWIDVLA